MEQSKPGFPVDDDSSPVLPDTIPSYQCIKIVKAIQITGVEQHPHETHHVIAHINLPDAEPITLRGKILARYVPQPGDYLVEYEDGYVSISPRDVFEKGYQLIPKPTED